MGRASPSAIPIRACWEFSPATCCAASPSPSSATASRRATSSTSTTSSTAGCGLWTRPRQAVGVFNLGSGRSLSINQLAQAAIAAFGHPPGGYKVIRAPTRPGEQRTVQADIRQAQSVLGWQPRTTFESGLGRDCPLGPRGVCAPRGYRGPGGGCTMKLLLVISVDPWTRSVVHHPQVCRGRPGARA